MTNEEKAQVLEAEARQADWQRSVNCEDDHARESWQRRSIALKAGAAALRAMAWKPIADAPKDRRLELYIPGMPDGYRVAHGKWNRQEYNSKPRPHWDYGCYMGAKHQYDNQPTHYRELPAPPEGV